MFLPAPEVPVSCWLECLPDLALACLPALCLGGMRKFQAHAGASRCLALNLIGISSPDCCLLSFCLTLQTSPFILSKYIFEQAQFAGGVKSLHPQLTPLTAVSSSLSSSWFTTTSGSFQKLRLALGGTALPLNLVHFGLSSSVPPALL